MLRWYTKSEVAQQCSRNVYFYKETTIEVSSYKRPDGIFLSGKITLTCLVLNCNNHLTMKL